MAENNKRLLILGKNGGGSVGTQVQSDWAETNTESVSYIKNKPSLATVATTGSYSDLSGTPSLSNVGVTPYVSPFPSFFTLIVFPSPKLSIYR